MSQQTSVSALQNHSSGKISRGTLLFPITVTIMCVILLFLAARMFGLIPTHLYQTEDRRFQKYTEQVFCSEMSGNTLNLHYTITDPSSYAIDSRQVSLGNACLKARKDSCAAAENYLSKLHAFHYEKLSPEHQLTYDIFQNHLNETLDNGAYLLYDEPLSPALGIQAQLPVLLAEYTFHTKKDIEDYLGLLAQIPDYFASVLSFERDKAAAGLFMSTDCAKKVAAQCRDFTADPKQHYLIQTFNEKIDRIQNLTTDEKISFKDRNQSILNGYVFPAYQELKQKLLSYAGSSKNSMGLYYLPEGTDYYRYLVKHITGDDRSVEQIEEAIRTQMLADYEAITQLSSGSTSTAPVSSSPDDPSEMIHELRQKITSDFPLLPSVSCEIKYVPDSMQKYLSPAFYLTPTIDNYQTNVIYINPGNAYTGLDLYTTLAHEGYPGHLYQSVYFTARQADLLRSILDVGGYTEGWATYVEMYAYSLWDGDPKTAAFCQHNRSFTLGLASLLDIGIHYHGYTPENVSDFLTRLGFSDEVSRNLYQTILQAPANYLQYYVGYLNFCDLRKEFQQRLGDQFSIKDFHRIILETGPAPFSILRRQLFQTYFPESELQ